MSRIIRTRREHKPFGVLKILIFDIETTPLKGWFWRCGDQVVRHSQLDVKYRKYKISTIAYKWVGDEEVHCLFGNDKITLFDKLVREADVVIGKNSDRFDVKHINTQRLLQGLKPLPEWLGTNDDVEKQLRRYFAFPSMSLDYVSSIFGLGGKEKMELQDWIDIENASLLKEIKDKIIFDVFVNAVSKVLFLKPAKEIFNLGKIALEKMIHYNKKDVTDTEAVLLRIAPYVQLRHNANAAKTGHGCRQCGSINIVPTKIIKAGKTRYQLFDCLEHNGYAGRATFKWDKHSNKRIGTIS